MKHKIEGDIRNCIEVANYDYSLSHLDEPMLNYYNELVAKAKAFDEILNIEDDFVKYHGFYPCVEEYAEEVEEIISEYTEDKQND